jgi:peptidoglycan/LPS O-acetylase OafA/YrhL
MIIANQTSSKYIHAERIPSLDGLRGIAIILVLLGHGGYSLPALTAPLLRFAGNGDLGVNIFFVLSGFLIYNLSVREIQKYGGLNWKNFYIRRALRIFPCLYFFLLVILLLKCSGMITLTWPMILAASTFSLNYRHLWDHGNSVSDYFVIGHYWSLALEWQFYLTWPLFMWLFVRRRLRSVLVAIMILAPFIRVACYFLTPGSRAQIGLMFHTGFDSIAAGVLLGELLQKPRSKAWLQSLAANPWIVCTTVIFIGLASPLLREHFRGVYGITIGKSLDLACICLIIINAVSFPESLLFRIFNWPPLAYIGVLSYSLYVWNNLFLYGGGHWLVNSSPVNYTCLFIMALLSYYLIEQPFLTLKHRLHKQDVLPIKADVSNL